MNNIIVPLNINFVLDYKVQKQKSFLLLFLVAFS